jgi:DNA-binding beta-propeller fold protein YncE
MTQAIKPFTLRRLLNASRCSPELREHLSAAATERITVDQMQSRVESFSGQLSVRERSTLQRIYAGMQARSIFDETVIESPALPEHRAPARPSLAFTSASAPRWVAEPDPKIADAAAGWTLELEHPVGSLLQTPDGKQLVAGTEHGVLVFDRRTGEQVSELNREDKLGNTPAISPDGSKVVYVTGGWTGQYDVVAIDLASGMEEWRQKTKEGAGGSPAFSPDGDLMVMKFSGGKLIGFDPEEGTPRWETEADYCAGALGFEPSPMPVAFAPDGKTFFSTDTRGLHGFSAADGAKLWSFKQDRLYTDAFTVSPDGKTVYCLETQSQIHAIDAATGEKKWAMQWNVDGAYGHPGVSVSPDGHRVLAIGTDGLVVPFDAHTGQLLEPTIPLSLGRANKHERMPAFRGEGSTAISVDVQGVFHKMNLDAGEDTPVGQPQDLPFVSDFVVSHDGRWGYFHDGQSYRPQLRAVKLDP